MKKAYCVFIVLILLAGCGEENKPLNQNISAGVDPNETSVADGASFPQESEFPSDNEHQAYEDLDLDDPKVLESILDEAVVGDEVKTGWRRVDHDNGKICSLSQFRDGRPDGLQFGWHENGQKSQEGNFKDGKDDGPWASWYENGQKRSEGKYKDGVSDGIWLSWYSNGNKFSEGNYENRKKEGLHTHWHRNGKKSSERYFKDGKEDGLCVWWHENGQKGYEVTYKDDEIVEGSEKFWNSKGEPVNSEEEAFAE